MPPHSRQSHIFKRAFAHLMMHDSFSLLFMPNDFVWVAVKAGWSCACVAERRWSRIRGQGRVTVWRCDWQANGDGWGRGGWRCKGLRLIEWSYWWLEGGRTRTVLCLNTERESKYWQTGRKTDKDTQKTNNAGHETIFVMSCSDNRGSYGHCSLENEVTLCHRHNECCQNTPLMVAEHKL